jgi:hypothetical protein
MARTSVETIRMLLSYDLLTRLLTEPHVSLTIVRYRPFALVGDIGQESPVGGWDSDGQTPTRHLRGQADVWTNEEHHRERNIDTAFLA